MGKSQIFVQPQPLYLEVFCLEFLSRSLVCRLVITTNLSSKIKLKNYKNICQQNVPGPR